MGRFLLPSFYGEGGEPAPRRARGWETFPISDLERFSKALRAPKDLQAAVFVDAIPDIWSKALLFAYSLRDESHTLHKRAVDAFRGFLAMLALRHLHKYNVTVAQVDIEPQSAHPFASALARLAPVIARSHSSQAESGALADHVGWDPAYVFMLDDEVAGIASPLTLIAPREGTDMPKCGARRLTDGFRFRDPVAELSSTDAALLREWLAKLQERITETAQPGLWRVAVTSQILRFQRALEAKAGAAQTTGIRYANGTLEIQTDLFAPLGRALDASVSSAVESSFELVTRPGAPDRLVVIDEEMIRHLAPDTEIISGITAAMLTGQPLLNNSRYLGRHEMPRGWRWIRPDYFFLPRMTVIQTPDAFVSVAKIPIQQGRSTDDSPVPPLLEEVARYLQADYVSRNCWYERSTDGITFKLRLQLAGKQSNFEARRSYKFSDLNRIDLYDVPVAEIWPSTRLSGWKAFYTFWVKSNERSSFYLRPCGKAVETSNRLDRYTSQEVTMTCEAPEYLACFELRDAADGIQPEPLGLLMPSFGQAEPNKMPRTFNIGFDFGTTNTHIFLHTLGGQPTALSISAETVRVFNNEDPKREGLMYRFFLPTGPDDAPFLSLLRRRVPLEGRFEALRDAHVLFYHQQVESAQFDDQAVESYLKWNPELNNDRNAFLRQLVLHAAYRARLEGANRLNFIYSYPTSFDEQTNEILDAFWGIDVPEMADLIGIDCELSGKQTESVATACYFAAEEGALTGTGTMVLDIGGGTTDISAWRKDKLEIQTSVRLSGRELLLIPIKENRDYLLDMLSRGMNSGSAIFDPLSKLEGERFYRRAEAILRAHREDLLKCLQQVMKTTEFERFRSEIALRFAALFYYAGLLLRQAKWLDVSTRLPDIYVGGNGCRVLDWLAPPKFQTTHPVVPLLMNAYARGAAAAHGPSQPRVVVSRKPKSEVASGLVYSLEKPLARPDEAVQVVAGERFEWNGEACAETRVLSATVLRNGVRVEKADEIESVLRVYNEFADRPGAILMPVTNVAEVVDLAKDEINNWAYHQTGTDAKSIQVAPVFIVGVVNAFRRVQWRSAAIHGISD